MKFEPMSCTYIDHMGSDLMVANAARVSFDKESDWDMSFHEEIDPDTRTATPITTKTLKNSDVGLLKYLALGFRTDEWSELIYQIQTAPDMQTASDILLRVKRSATHWAPFAHPHLSVRCVAPVFVARQLVKHQIGLTWSEVSRRYVDSDPTYYDPELWHLRPEANIKQGAGSVIDPESTEGRLISDMMVDAVNTSDAIYKVMLQSGVAPEEARMVLPLNAMVTWVWTGSLLAFCRVLQQRLDGHAQTASREFAGQLADIVQEKFPVSFDMLCGSIKI